MKVLEALTKLLPEDQANKLAPAVEAMLEEAKQDLDKEYNKNLEEAYAKLAEELKSAEGVAEQGYTEAYSIIQDLRSRIEVQQAEFEQSMDEGYEEAYQMLLAERAKNEKLEVEIYEEYDKKLAEMREYMIDKIDEFLTVKGKDIYEQARRELLNDPQVAEHKVAMDKVVEILSDYISQEDYTLAASSKLGEALKNLEEMRNKQRILEARNMRLSTENKKLNENVRSLNESVQANGQTITEERKERVETAKQVTGRGQKVSDQVKVIAEHDATNADKADEAKVVPDALRQMRVLAGLQTSKQ
jgi:hypothetical protein